MKRRRKPTAGTSVTANELTPKAAAVVLPMLRSPKITYTMLWAMHDRLEKLRRELYPDLGPGLVNGEPSRRRRRVLLPEFERMMAKKASGNTQEDLDAVRGDR